MMRSKIGYNRDGVLTHTYLLTFFLSLVTFWIANALGFFCLAVIPAWLTALVASFFFSFFSAFRPLFLVLCGFRLLLSSSIVNTIVFASDSTWRGAWGLKKPFLLTSCEQNSACKKLNKSVNLVSYNRKQHCISLFLSSDLINPLLIFLNIG